MPKYFFLVSTVAPLYFRKRSTSAPPFLKISSSSLLQRILLSLVSMQLSNWMKSPETWSNLQSKVLMGRFTILEYSFKISFNSLQLVGMPFFVSFFFSVFFSATSRDGALCLFLSYFFSSTFFSSTFFSSLGSLIEILIQLSSKDKYPSTPYLQIQLTIFFISDQPILDKQSLYLDLILSKLLCSLFFATISSKHLEVIALQAESSSKSSRSS